MITYKKHKEAAVYQVVPVKGSRRGSFRSDSWVSVSIGNKEILEIRPCRFLVVCFDLNPGPISAESHRKCQVYGWKNQETTARRRWNKNSGFHLQDHFCHQSLP